VKESDSVNWLTPTFPILGVGVKQFVAFSLQSNLSGAGREEGRKEEGRREEEEVRGGETTDRKKDRKRERERKRKNVGGGGGEREREREKERHVYTAYHVNICIHICIDE